jgi:hypothetical protein
MGPVCARCNYGKDLVYITMNKKRVKICKDCFITNKDEITIADINIYARISSSNEKVVNSTCFKPSGL